MFKLLSDEMRQRVAGEYATRRLVVMVGSLALAFAVGVVGLFPSYILSSVRNDEVSERAKVALSQEPDRASLDMQKWLSDINLKLKALSPVEREDSLSSTIEKILAEKIVGIHLNSFSWRQGDEATTISVSGVAESRQTLLAFENQLKGSGLFQEVTLPVSNLAKDKDILFQVKLTPVSRP